MQDKKQDTELQDEPVLGPHEDVKTDRAVEDIMKHEGEEVLHAQEVANFTPPEQPWYKKIFGNKKVWIPAAIVLAIVALGAVPLTRYALLGLVVKQDYALQVLDVQTNKPVSAATLSVAGQKVETDNRGRATLRTNVGPAELTIAKKYYTTKQQSILVGLKKGPVHVFQVQATGRQVPLLILNKISGKPLANAEIAAAGTKVKTDKNGKVVMVLPAHKATVSGTLSATHFNSTTVNIRVTTAESAANTFYMTPAGRIHFLSNASGKIDVVSTNLDGTDRQTVLAGTGYEDLENTVLLASRDWKYVALQSKREKGNNTQLNLIETTTGKVTNIDKGEATFTLVGWSDEYFVYVAHRQTVQNWQPKKQALKSFHAPSKRLLTLDETEGSGSGQHDYAYTSFSAVLSLRNELVYAKNWASYSATWRSSAWLSDKKVHLVSVRPDGSNRVTVKEFSIPTGYISQYGYSYYDLSLVSYKPQEIYVRAPNGDPNTDTYYEYENRTLKQKNELTLEAFRKAYATYLLSPSGNQTFWSEPRDGKNSLFVGTATGDSPKTLLSLSEYQTYGWYGNEYVLVSKKGSELYIMPAAGGSQLKVSDYYKPAQTFYGYGGGYGGL